ncbi:hypothetical protein GF407_07230 [candidate division KSB1 bacterium]|nr:hypothetical protein [candidate division KSB1 bacterium]
MDFVTPVAFFFLIGYATTEITNHRTRIKILEKNAAALNEHYQHTRYGSLKWGMILIAIGISLIIGKSLNDLLTISLMFILAGLSLLLYHLVIGRLTGKR